MIQFEESEGLEPVSTDTMTPMIDVILSLIAFMMLMINAPLLTMDVDLPEVISEQNSAPTQTIFLRLDVLEPSEQWRVDGVAIQSRLALEEALTAHVVNADEPVTTLINIDQNTVSQRLIDTLDILQSLGIDDAQIALEQSPTSQAGGGNE